MQKRNKLKSNQKRATYSTKQKNNLNLTFRSKKPKSKLFRKNVFINKKKALFTQLLFKKQLLKFNIVPIKKHLKIIQIRKKKTLVKRFRYKKRFRKGLYVPKLKNFRFIRSKKLVFRYKIAM